MKTKIQNYTHIIYILFEMVDGIQIKKRQFNLSWARAGLFFWVKTQRKLL